MPTSEFLYLITNHVTDAIKAVVHTVNVKFRKLKKNNVRNTNKTRQLKQSSQNKCLKFLRGRADMRAASGSRTKKGFAEIKPVPVVKHVVI